MKDAILPEVKKALQKIGVKTVITTGHSVEDAISQIDAVYLRQKLPANVAVSNIGFGSPRVGNCWAKLVDWVLGNSQIHIVHDCDVFSRLPPKASGYKQARNEICINKAGDSIVLCQENDSEGCSNGVSQWRTSASAHAGPYFGVELYGGLC